MSECQMEIKSLISIVAGLESVKSRRLTIKKSWSEQEKEVRRRNAMEAQLRLASLLELLVAVEDKSTESKLWAAFGWS